MSNVNIELVARGAHEAAALIDGLLGDGGEVLLDAIWESVETEANPLSGERVMEQCMESEAMFLGIGAIMTSLGKSAHINERITALPGNKSVATMMLVVVVLSTLLR